MKKKTPPPPRASKSKMTMMTTPAFPPPEPSPQLEQQTPHRMSFFGAARARMAPQLCNPAGKLEAPPIHPLPPADPMLHHFIEAHHASSYLINFIMPCHPPSYTSSYFAMLPCTTRDFVIHRHTYLIPRNTMRYYLNTLCHTWLLTIPCSTSWCLIIPTPAALSHFILPYLTKPHHTYLETVHHFQRTALCIFLNTITRIVPDQPCFTSSYLPNLIPHYTCLKHHHNCFASSIMNRYSSKLHQTSSCLRNSDLPYCTSQCFVKPHPASSTIMCHTSSVFFTPDHTSACLLILCQTSSQLIVLHGSSSSIVKPTSRLKKPHQRSKLLIPHHAASYLYHIPYVYLILTVPQTLSKLVKCHDHLLSYLINVHSSS